MTAKINTIILRFTNNIFTKTPLYLKKPVVMCPHIFRIHPIFYPAYKLDFDIAEVKMYRN